MNGYSKILPRFNTKVIGCVTRPHWQLLVDEQSNMKFLFHHETTSGMVDPTCVKLRKLADIAGNIAHLRQDNTGENLKWPKGGEVLIGR